MPDHIQIGKSGEDLACRYLTVHGYKIIERNWRWGHHEIDIVARQGNEIVIVEVKTHRADWSFDPESSVVPRKQRILVNAANAWMRYRKAEGEIRFDVIAVILGNDQHTIRHIEDAFYAF
jgi:putative endonuclease